MPDVPAARPPQVCIPTLALESTHFVLLHFSLKTTIQGEVIAGPPSPPPSYPVQEQVITAPCLHLLYKLY